MPPLLRQYSADEILKLLKTKKSDFWVAEGRKRSLALFHNAAERVPAYKDFLKKHNIKDHTKIKIWDDFQSIPVVDKKNYLRQYPLEKLCWDGTLKKPMVFTATSGSTGEPFYFPRDERLDRQSAIMHEMFLQSSGLNAKKSTLVIVCFGMGVWIGGLITYQAFRALWERGYPITLITPGVNKKEIFDALKHIGKKYDQLILCGYPPFIKDVIDDGKANGIRWKGFDIRIVFAAEAFSEQFRQYILEETGIEEEYTRITNIYGTADLGTMAQETPISVFTRRAALHRESLFESLFNSIKRTPTLAQFNPLFINFEAVNGNILCTGDNVLPLVRYAIGDHGGVAEYNEVAQKLEWHRVPVKKETHRLGISNTVSELPFVYVYERADLSTKLYGAIIYPEHIKTAVQHQTAKKILTGKFTVLTQHDEQQNQYLEIHLERKPRVKTDGQSIKEAISKLITKHLLQKNSEYKYLSSSIPDKVKPRITFWDYEHPLHFKPGGKQKWVKK